MGSFAVALMLTGLAAAEPAADVCDDETFAVAAIVAHRVHGDVFQLTNAPASHPLVLKTIAGIKGPPTGDYFVATYVYYPQADESLLEELLEFDTVLSLRLCRDDPPEWPVDSPSLRTMRFSSDALPVALDHPLRAYRFGTEDLEVLSE